MPEMIPTTDQEYYSIQDIRRLAGGHANPHALRAILLALHLPYCYQAGRFLVPRDAAERVAAEYRDQEARLADTRPGRVA